MDISVSPIVDERRIAELANQILKHKRLYYSGQPEISDEHFDELEEQLRRLDPRHPALDVVGVTPDTNLAKVEHQRPMLSLNKTYSYEDLLSWVDGRPIVGTVKIDGNSLSIIYRQGQMSLAKTRGNGRVGEDVTAKVTFLADVPNFLAQPIDCEVRGELLCHSDQFFGLCQTMKARGLEVPTNPRNIVAGVLGRKSHLDLARHFSFLAFDLLGDFDLRSEQQKFEVLKDLGFALPFHRLISQESEVRSFLDQVQEQIEGDQMALDGAVFTYDDLALHQSLGETSHHPRFKIAFKWQGQTATTRILAITWSTSRLGVVTPVAEIEPVNLSGATISNVTLHNAAMVKSFDLKAGDEIEIVRSGEVIPKFLRVITAGDSTSAWPEYCPSCGSFLVFDEVRLRCPNAQGCPAQKLRTVLNWMRSVEIDDLSEKRLGALFDAGLVSDAASLYRLSVEDFLTLPQTKEKLAQKLFKNIQASKAPPLAQFLSGLGIEGTGQTTWSKLIDAFGDLEGILAAQPSEIEQLEGFAQKSAEQIVEGLHQSQVLIASLRAAGVEPQVPARSLMSQDLEGLSFVITGSLSRPREEISKWLQSLGAKVTSSVSKHTHAVVTDDPTSQSSKAKKARSLDVPMWSEQQLRDFVLAKSE